MPSKGGKKKKAGSGNSKNSTTTSPVTTANSSSGSGTGSGGRKAAARSSEATGWDVREIEAICDDSKLWQESPVEAFQHLYRALEALREKQRESSAAPEAAEPGSEVHTARWARFWDWVVENGGTELRENVEVGYLDQLRGHGVRAKRDFRAGEIMMRVPSGLMLSVDGLLSSVTTSSEDIARNHQAATLGMSFLQDGLLSSNPTMCLALVLVFERLRGEGSFFSPYLDILPCTFMVPLYWTPEELQLVSQSPAHMRALQTWRITVKQYCYISHVYGPRGPFSSAFPSAQSLTFDLFRWALCSTITRQNRVPSLLQSGKQDQDQGQGQGPGVLALIPVWDMCNHAQGPNTTGFDMSPESHGLVCEAMNDYAPGDEVHIFYGPRPNAELFLYSGFVASANPHHEGSLTLTLPSASEEPLVKMKLILLQKLGLEPRPAGGAEGGMSVVCRIGPEGLVESDTTLRSVFRVACLDKAGCSDLVRSLASKAPPPPRAAEGAQGAQGAAGQRPSECPFISSANDAAAAQLLRDTCDTRRGDLTLALEHLSLTVSAEDNGDGSGGGSSPSTDGTKGTGAREDASVTKRGIARALVEAEIRLLDATVAFSESFSNGPDLPPAPPSPSPDEATQTAEGDGATA